jgi:hypothetical protein
MCCPMPVAEILDRFTIALVKLYLGNPKTKTAAIGQIIYLAPFINFNNYKHYLLPLFEINKGLWILEDQMHAAIKNNEEANIIDTAIGIRDTNLKRCDIKKEIANIAGEITDAAKTYS